MEAYKIVEVYAKDGDDWSVSPPIQGYPATEGYSFPSSRKSSTPLTTTVVPSYLMDWEETSNEIDFLTKTKSLNSKDKSVLNGVGGVASLKNFKFAIKRKSVETRKLIGCLVKVWDVKDGVPELKLTAKIDSSESDSTRTEFTVKGKFAMTEAVLTGTPSPASFGGQQFVPLTKRTDNFGNTRLLFDPSKHTIRDIYVKGKKDEFTSVSEDPVYYPVGTDYNIIQDQINFKSAYNTDVTLFGKYPDSYTLDISDKATLLVKFRDSEFTSNPPVTLKQTLGYGGFLWFQYDKEIKFNGSLYHLYSTNALGSYEPIVSKIFEQGYLKTTTPQEEMVYITSFVVIKTCRVPLQIMNYPISLVDIAPEDMTLTDYIWSGYWATNPNLIQRTEKVSRQQVLIRTEQGYDFPLVKVDPFIFGNQTEAITQILVDSASVSQTDWESWFSSSTVGHVFDVYNQDGAEDVVDVIVDCPLSAIQNLHNLSYSTNSVEYQMAHDFSSTIRNNEWSEILPNERSNTYIGSADLLFDIPTLSGDVRLSFLTGSFDVQPLWSEPYSGSRDLLAWVSLSGDNRFFGRGQGRHGNEEVPPVWVPELENISFETPWLAFSQVGDSTFHYSGKRIFSLTGRWEESTSTFHNFQKSTTVKFKELVERPVTLSDWRDETFSVNSMITRELVDEGSTLSVSRDTKLTFLLEASLKDNEFYALVEDTNISPSEADYSLPANDGGYPITNFGLIANDTVLSVTSKNPSGGYIVRFFDLGVTPTIISTLPAEYIFEPIPAQNLFGETGIYIRDYFRKWENGSLQSEENGFSFRKDLRSKGIKIVNSRWHITFQGDQILFTQRKGLNDSRNPVTIAYNILTRGMGFPEAEIDTASFSLTSEARDTWVHSFQTTNRVSAITVLGNILKESGLIVYESTNGQFTVIDLNPPSEEEVTKTLLTEHLFIKGDSFTFGERYDSLGYLVSDLTVEYNKEGSTYQSSIPTESFPNQEPFNQARSFLGEQVRENRMTLETVFESNTALSSGALNMNYHATPARFLTIPYYGVELSIGEWFKIDSPLIPSQTGAVYIALQTRSIGFISEVACYEVDLDGITEVIQETPEDVSLIYEEDPTALDEIQEVLS
jgi:hypothetical protein